MNDWNFFNSEDAMSGDPPDLKSKALLSLAHSHMLFELALIEMKKPAQTIDLELARSYFEASLMLDDNEKNRRAYHEFLVSGISF